MSSLSITIIYMKFVEKIAKSFTLGRATMIKTMENIYTWIN